MAGFLGLADWQQQQRNTTTPSEEVQAPYQGKPADLGGGRRQFTDKYNNYPKVNRTPSLETPNIPGASSNYNLDTRSNTIEFDRTAASSTPSRLGLVPKESDGLYRNPHQSDGVVTGNRKVANLPSNNFVPEGQYLQKIPEINPSTQFQQDGVRTTGRYYGRATMKVPTDRADYFDTKSTRPIDVGNNVVPEGYQFKTRVEPEVMYSPPATGAGGGKGGGSIPPEEPAPIDSSRVPFKTTLKSLGKGVLGGIATYAADKGTGYVLEGLSRYSSKNDPGGSPVGNNVGDAAQQVIFGRVLRDVALNGGAPLEAIRQKVLGGFQRRDESQDVPAAAPGSAEEKKYQAKVEAEKQQRLNTYSAGQDARSGVGRAPGSAVVNEITGLPMGKPSSIVDKDGHEHSMEADPFVDDEASRKYASPYAGKDMSAAAGVVNQGKTNGGLVRQIMAREAEKAPSTPYRARLEAIVNSDHPDTGLYKVAKKELDKMDAMDGHYSNQKNSVGLAVNPTDGYLGDDRSKEFAQWKNGNSGIIQGPNGEPARLNPVVGAQGNIEFETNPEYIAYQNKYAKNPVSLASIGEHGETIYSANPNRVDPVTGRTELQQLQWEQSPEYAAQKHMNDLMYQSRHASFMGREDVADKLNAQISLLNKAAAEERASKYESDNLLKGNANTNETSRFTTGAEVAGRDRTNQATNATSVQTTGMTNAANIEAEKIKADAVLFTGQQKMKLDAAKQAVLGIQNTEKRELAMQQFVQNVARSVLPAVKDDNSAYQNFQKALAISKWTPEEQAKHIDVLLSRFMQGQSIQKTENEKSEHWYGDDPKYPVPGIPSLNIKVPVDDEDAVGSYLNTTGDRV